jgi:hypothetical protein
VNLGIIFQIATALPSVIKAVQTILASNEAHTIESAVSELIQHNTAGQPNSSALSPTAHAIDFQAPSG